MEDSDTHADFFDARAFRQCLGQFSTGVTIVTAFHDGEKFGVTANSFSSLSLDPPLIIWSIGRRSRSFDAFAHAERFAVNILADDQVDLSQRFASKAVDKFANVDWRPGQNEAPLIDGAAASIECTTEARHEGGDHVLIVGRVTDFSVTQRKVLIFSQGRYRVGLDHPVFHTERGELVSPIQGNELASDSFGTLVYKSHLCWSEGFEARRDSLGLSVGKGRILYFLSRHDRMTVDELVRKANLPSRELRDEVCDLHGTGSVHCEPDGTIRLTDTGRNLREAMRREVAAYEEDTLRGISMADLAITKRTLIQYLNHGGSGL